MKKGEYRKFRIKTAGPQDPRTAAVFLDDFAAMEQVVRRRYTRAGEGRTFRDLIVIDGGKGQLNAAYAALEASGCRTW